MKTKVLTGFFGVREFSTNRLKNEDEIIRFTTTYTNEADIPAEFKARSRQYTNRNNEARWAVEFKISAGARWFDKYGAEGAKPTNAELENKKFEVVIDYRDVVATEKYNAEKKRFNPDGLYVNCIMYKSAAANPFEGEAFEQAEPTPTPTPATPTPATPATPAAPTPALKTDDGLPF